MAISPFAGSPTRAKKDKGSELSIKYKVKASVPPGQKLPDVGKLVKQLPLPSRGDRLKRIKERANG